jgi:hypothetical protein
MWCDRNFSRAKQLDVTKIISFENTVQQVQKKE